METPAEQACSGERRRIGSDLQSFLFPFPCQFCRLNLCHLSSHTLASWYVFSRRATHSLISSCIFLLCLAKSEEEKLKNSATLKPFFSSASDDRFCFHRICWYQSKAADWKCLIALHIQMGLIDSLMEDQTMIQNQFCSFSVVMRGLVHTLRCTYESFAQASVRQDPHQRFGFHDQSWNGGAGNRFLVLLCDYGHDIALLCQSFWCTFSSWIKSCVQNLLHFMILYVYFGILLTEVEAECSSSFGSTGKCREEAHCSQGEQTKGLHHYLSIASTCLKQNASKLFVHFLL